MQSGHKLGLCNPGVVLHEEDEHGQLAPRQKPVNLTAWQQYLWEVYLWCIAEVKDLAKDDPIFLVHNGDLTHGNVHAGTMVSDRLADQLLIAEANFWPWLDLPDLTGIRLTSGTPSHEFFLDSAPVLVAEMLTRHPRQPNVGVVQHGLCEVAGIIMDYAHHGPGPGIRDWLRGNQLRYYMRSILAEHLRTGLQPPDLVVRSHFHEYVRETIYYHNQAVSTIDEKRMDGILTPSFSGLTEHGRKVTRSTYLLGNGLVAAEIEDGQVRRIQPFIKNLDLRRKEAIDA